MSMKESYQRGQPEMSSSSPYERHPMGHDAMHPEHPSGSNIETMNHDSQHMMDSNMQAQRPESKPSIMSQSMSAMEEEKVSIPDAASHNPHNLFSRNDPANPQNFPLWKKLHVTLASFLAVFALVYAATVPTPVIPLLPEALGTTPRLAKLALTAPFFGVFFAPIYTPHVTERVGRKPVYIVSMSLFIIFVGAISAAKTINQLIILRMFAGLVGGPMAVLIEGSHADVWSARKTVSYYCSISLAQYWGAAFGPIIGAQALKMGVPWTAYSALIIACVAWVLLWTMPETYPREILRSKNVKLPKALSGVTFLEMARVTFIDPINMTMEPIVVMSTFLLGLCFAVVFQWFVTVPVVLAGVYGFSSQSIGFAFFSAVVGAAMAFITSLSGDRGSMRIECRLYGAMLGVVLTTVSLFWVGWTAKPSVSPIVPIIGTGVYVWGNMSIITAVISYIFDAYPAKGTLSALTLMACFRLACAGILPIFILDIFAAVTPPWTLSILGFLHLLAMPIPFVLFFFGARLRERSPYSASGMSTVAMQTTDEKTSESA